MTELKGVIFDLDGVLVRTSRFHGQAWKDLLVGLGHPVADDLEERVKGISRMESLKVALGANVASYSHEQLEALADQKNRRYLELVEHLGPADLLDGAKALLNGLKAAGIAVVLGSASKNARPILERLGIGDYFQAVADGHAFAHSKPHPDVFVSAAKLAGLSPAECIVIEDAAAGVTAAVDGGFVAVGMGSPESLRHAHLFIHGLAELSVPRLRQLHARHRAELWTVRRQGVHEPKIEDSLNTIFCVSNGRLGIRGTLPQLPSDDAGVFLAGFYDRIHRPAHDPAAWSPYMKYWGDEKLALGPQVEACIVNCPNFIDAQWIIDGEEIDFSTGKLLALTRSLDLRSGIFTAEAHWVSPAGKELRLTQRRLASLADTAVVHVEHVLEPINFSAPVEFRARIGTGTSNHVNPREQIYDVAAKTRLGGASAAVLVRGKADKMPAAFAAAVQMLDRPNATTGVDADAANPAAWARADARRGQLLYVHQTAAVADERRSNDPMSAASATLAAAGAQSFESARIDSAALWRQYWDQSDVLIEGADDDQLAVRFSIYNLLAAASRDDDAVSIPAKALTSDGYRGMVFWDTDIYMMPFYSFTQPALARNLAMFRCRTLDGARQKARRYGQAGAAYPWETGVSGLEECEKWLKLITHQSHVTADVAYALAQYVECSADEDFHLNHAAEVFLETARFWLAKAVPNADGSLSIPDAGGPDECHVVCDDSAFILNIAAWNLRLAHDTVRFLQRHDPDKLADIRARTGLDDTEIERLASWPPRLKTMQGPDGLFEQCRGFFQLKDEKLDTIWIAGHLTQTVKQADVMLLFYLLPGQWPAAVVRRNWDYYEPRTAHASSLSHAVHGIVAAEIGLADKARDYMRRSLGMDLSDEMGNAAGGAHMAANGMNWVAMVRGFGGAWPMGDRFVVAPRLPAGWTRLAFTLKWRGADFTVEVTPDRVTVSNNPAARSALPLTLGGKDFTVAPGQTVSTSQVGRAT